MIPAIAAVTTAALEKGLSRIVTSIVASAVGTGTAAFAAWKSERALRQAVGRLDHVRMVKTIWQIDRAVDLTDFYYRSRIIVQHSEVPVWRLEDIPTAGNVIVQGTVGQGKSVFLRHLAIITALDGERLPLFIELRRIQAAEKLESHIFSELEVLGLPVDHREFTTLAESGRLLLLLDAFDEVKEERRAQLVHELEVLARRHPTLRIVITSRPAAGIERSPFWTVYPLAPLAGREYEEFIHRICHDKQTAEAIVAGLRASRRSVAALLTTPLMVAMLVLRHRADHSIPENQVAFFSDLFTLLLQRYDKTKAGYVRQRKSSIGDKALERVFVAICFLTRKRGAAAFSGQEIFGVARQALSLVGVKASADEVLEDIRSITCLLLEEGGEYRFLHKIIQEYHAACYIVHEPEANAQAFYEAMTSRWRYWQEELTFLEILDGYRYLKFFAVPMLRAYTEEPSGLALAVAALREVGVELASEDRTAEGLEVVRVVSVTIPSDPAAGWVFLRMRRGSSAGLINHLLGDVPVDEVGRVPFDTGPVITGLALFERNVLKRKLRRFGQAFATFITEQLAAAEQVVAEADQRRNLMSF